MRRQRAADNFDGHALYKILRTFRRTVIPTPTLHGAASTPVLTDTATATSYLSLFAAFQGGTPLTHRTQTTLANYRTSTGNLPHLPYTLRGCTGLQPISETARPRPQWHPSRHACPFLPHARAALLHTVPQGYHHTNGPHTMARHDRHPDQQEPSHVGRIQRPSCAFGMRTRQDKPQALTRPPPPLQRHCLHTMCRGIQARATDFAAHGK